MKPETGAGDLRSCRMRIAIVAATIFVAGLLPGLIKSGGPLPDAPVLAKQAAAPPSHPALVRMAGLLKLRF